MYTWILAIGVSFLFACSQDAGPDRRGEADVVMLTDRGTVYIKLFDEAPKHKENFLKLTREGFYDGLAFHRVIPGFMVQAGDPRTREGATDMETDDAGYKLPAEINDEFIHTEGMLAAARYPDNINPDWESSSSQFYIVTGVDNSDAKLDSVEENYNYLRQARLYQDYQKALEEETYDGTFNDYLADQDFVFFGYSEEQRAAYRQKEGVPHLDFQYTIFGEVVHGMDVIERVEYTPTDDYNRPTDTIRIQKMVLAENYTGDD